MYLKDKNGNTQYARGSNPLGCEINRILTKRFLDIEKINHTLIYNSCCSAITTYLNTIPSGKTSEEMDKNQRM
jgi:hypothetical protein